MKWWTHPKYFLIWNHNYVHLFGITIARTIFFYRNLLYKDTNIYIQKFGPIHEWVNLLEPCLTHMSRPQGARVDPWVSLPTLTLDDPHAWVGFKGICLTHMGRPIEGFVWPTWDGLLWAWLALDLLSYSH